MKKFKYYQYVLIEWHTNKDNEIVKFVSDSPIFKSTIYDYLYNNEDWDIQIGDFTLIDKPKTVIL